MSAGPRQRRGLLDWAVASRTLAGQSESGDLHVVVPFSGGALVGAVDGLGHGDDAAAAAQRAAGILREAPEDSVITLLRRCHAGLVETRGAVISLASFSARDTTMTWTGVGNVEGILLRADPTATPPRETLLLRGGVIGYQLPQLYASVIPLMRGDALVFATDGVRTDFAAGVALGEPPQQLADRIMAQYGKGTDDALVLVAEFVGGQP